MLGCQSKELRLKQVALKSGRVTIYHQILTCHYYKEGRHYRQAEC